MSARILLAPAIALALATAGCGSSSSSPSSSGNTTHTHAASAPNPNAPEKNPPGDIPDTQVYVAYTPPGGGYTLKVPEGWARAASAGAVTFSANLNSVRIEHTAATAAPTVASAKATEVPRLASAAKGFQLRTVSTVRRPAGSAVKVSYLADSAPDSVTGRVTRDAVERYTFFHAGHDLVLTLSGPKGADNVDPWKLITGSVRWR